MRRRGRTDNEKMDLLRGGYDFHLAIQLEDGSWADKSGDGYYNSNSAYIAIKKNQDNLERGYDE